MHCLFVTCIVYSQRLLCINVLWRRFWFWFCFCLSSLLMKCFMNELMLDANVTNKIRSERNRHWAMIFPSAVECVCVCGVVLFRLLCVFFSLARRMKMKIQKRKEKKIHKQNHHSMFRSCCGRSLVRLNVHAGQRIVINNKKKHQN